MRTSRRLICVFLLLVAAAAAAGQVPLPDSALTPEQYRADARSIEGLINSRYAYLDRFEGLVAPIAPTLRAEGERVTDRRSLLVYAERVLLALADHHAITGASTSHSWAIVPSYADLWIERIGADYRIEAVRSGSPAAAAGIRPGDLLAAVSGIPIDRAVAGFWNDLGLAVTPERAGFAARILAAGRRDAPRQIAIRSGSSPARRIDLPNLYGLPGPHRSPLASASCGAALLVHFNDSLGETATIAAFDALLARAPRGQSVILDLTDTPSGGNTVVARAIMGWFVSAPRGYQIHNLPAEQRETGIGRQWMEQVLPRPGKHHAGRVIVRVGRWTGSMGEGLAIGFDALGARVEGGRMAGLRGAVYDHRLANSGLVIKLPTERLFTVGGVPREAFVPAHRAPDARNRALAAGDRCGPLRDSE